MTFNESLSDKFLSIPRDWMELGYKSYFDCVEGEGLKYIKFIESIEEFDLGQNAILGALDKQSLLQVVKEFYSSLMRVLSEYLDKGSPHLAYKAFDESFGIRDNIISTPRQLGFFLDYKDMFPYAYRLRSVTNPSIDEMFHVPFHKREKISSFRYSIPGYPTLYLSNCIYLAFRELNCPNYDDLYAVKIQQRFSSQRESLLDMRNQPLFFQDEYKYKYLARWLLIMSCSVIVCYPKEPFRPEYIIPQITLQWVKNNMLSGNNKILGVCYSSSKIDMDKGGFIGEFYNVALPIQLANKFGHCEMLKSKFWLTKPISFKDVLSQNINAKRQSQAISINLNGTQVDYINTDFGKIEEALEQAPFNEYYFVGETKLDHST